MIAALGASAGAPQDVAWDAHPRASPDVVVGKLVDQARAGQGTVATPETLPAAISVEMSAMLALCKPGAARSAE